MYRVKILSKGGVEFQSFEEEKYDSAVRIFYNLTEGNIDPDEVKLFKNTKLLRTHTKNGNSTEPDEEE